MNLIIGLIKSIPFNWARNLAKQIEWEQHLSPVNCEIWVKLCHYAGTRGLAIEDISGEVVEVFLKKHNISYTTKIPKGQLGTEALLIVMDSVFKLQLK